ncbi:MAG: hypothetical protein K2X66_02945 [Cyanobacteria bacterium]|nr:hypothetical protein [Cyanobacteriota bacterium]
MSVILYIPYYLFILLPYLLILALGMHLDFGQFSGVMIFIDFALFYFLGRFLMRVQWSKPLNKN